MVGPAGANGAGAKRGTAWHAGPPGARMASAPELAIGAGGGSSSGPVNPRRHASRAIGFG
eukprot:6438626-Alexandrium_andersonii.AAC.1